MKHVFLSYSHDLDFALVDRVKLRLRGNTQFDIFDSFEAIEKGGKLMPQIASQIQRASIVVSFMSTTNPNVFYEIGLAIGAGKNVLAVGRDPEVMPGDLKLLPFVALSGDIESDAVAIVERLQKLQVREEQPRSQYSSVREKLETYWSDRVYFDSVSPMEFEELLFEWFALNGFNPQKPDQPAAYGIDIIACSPNDRSMIVVEAKKFNHQSRVSVKEVMALLGAATLMKVDKAALITSSSFTAAALEMAKRSPGSKLYLLTVDDLLRSPDPSLLFK
jgi:hypothetical protein